MQGRDCKVVTVTKTAMAAKARDQVAVVAAAKVQNVGVNRVEKFKILRDRTRIVGITIKPSLGSRFGPSFSQRPSSA
jgi:hypothetical protein